MGHLKENSKGVFSGFNIFGSVPDTDAETLSLAARKADVFIVVNASTIELLDLERYIEETVGERPLVLWNLELDTLRADLGTLHFCCTMTQISSTLIRFEGMLTALKKEMYVLSWLQHCPLLVGLLGFPPKELQFRFLSQFTPVFYIRQRDYSKVLVMPGSLGHRRTSYNCVICELRISELKSSVPAERGSVALHHQLQRLHFQGVPWALAGEIWPAFSVCGGLTSL